MIDKKTASDKEPKIKSPEKNAASLGMQQKKISYIKKRIIFNLTILSGLSAVIVIILLYYLGLKKTNETQINQITSYISSLRNKTSNIKSKINEAKKYQKIWETTSENKKSFKGINITEVNNIFSDLSVKYNIINPSIKISVPETLKDPAYSRPTIDVVLSSVTISFNALTDVKAMSFIRDFIDSLPGYIVITDFSIRKTLESGYSETELVNISLGKFTGAMDVKLDFSWYVLKKKGINK